MLPQSSTVPPKVDVFISGAGPVGLLLAYHLTKLHHSVYIVDSADKASPDFPMYGRASTLFARSLEMLDQLDLYDALAQEGLHSCQTFTYRNGERVHGRGWKIFENPGSSGTFFEETMNLRLKFSEDIIRGKLEELGGEVHAPWKVVGLEVDEDAEDDYKCRVECVDPEGKTRERREEAGWHSIPWTAKDRHWVRMDGVVKTNIPEARNGFGSVESPSHGQVLWLALDHGATRIGYALNDKLFEKYGRSMTPEQAVYDAKAAVAPFELEFERVDWHTVYGIQQCVAERLVDRERIILAGDAAHAHSSGLAHGMNTGVHDVVNLGWRLAGVIKGWFGQPILQNYSDERRGVAHQLIENDKIASSLIGGERPEQFKGRPEDDMALLGDFLEQTSGFALGVGIFYPKNLLNDVDNALGSVPIQPGHRAADTLLHKPGLRRLTVRLHELMKYNGKYRILVFTGKPHLSQSLLQTLRLQVDKHQQRFAHAVDYMTIIDGHGKNLDEYLGVRRFGSGFWDGDSTAHMKFGAAENLGCIVVVRPDGIVGASAALDGFEDKIVPYFGRILLGVAAQKGALTNGLASVGQLINPFENNLEHSRKNAAMLA
ncbi:hypothetical protein M409DRAFT_26276 [Zasmidium cellare ATCC 36951]|uniref:Uncharacterized protein n=1 Tax=Zasmidium cellare ATCC 36951 TaxID=1080233 RepID=A0A6A6CBD6_ZASCE|nr:uncharacterized protein M409DRAFT_26276 [Zasmidium cellare ATCC 36951]KAF2163232.1 hypothetical protein M409DRAFT_26276 [Zasmidium cellare ATCC 36951]